MKSILITFTLLGSLSSFASFTDRAKISVERTDENLITLTSEEFENALETASNHAAISADLFFNCGKLGKERMRAYNINPSCKAAVNKAHEAGFSDEQIQDSINRSEAREEAKISPAIRQLMEELEQRR